MDRRVEKRNRPPVSCEPCRTRKLKCNRSIPCDSCIKRNISNSCTYAANANRSRPQSSKPRDVKDRLNALETLVSSFISPEVSFTSEIAQDNSKILLSPSESSSSKESVPLPETPRLQQTADGQVNYIDPSHWLSILEDIKEVREHLSISNQPIAKAPTSDTTSSLFASDASLLFGSTQISQLAFILKSLPSQPICDMLLSWYFNSRFMVLGIVHPAKFQVEYAEFWNSPETTSPVWVGLLFAILSIAVCLRQIANIPEAQGSIPPLAELQQQTTQCLVLGRYTAANSHALETLVLHLQTCFYSGQGNDVDPWFEMGTIIRLAFRLGYHRDPSTLAGISAFDGEMRRRVWLNIFQIDALISFALGFPSMIPTDFCDTAVPRNLEDSDLRIDMSVLPASRPLSENTPVLYTIVKSGVMAIFKKIVAHTQALLIPPYSATMALDTEMKTVYNAIPELLQRRDVNRSFLDNACIIWQRSTIEILYLKGLILLHRRYISYEIQKSASPSFATSRRACIESALGILARQADLHNACQPGGRLYEERWMMASLQAHDFLLAAMVICLDLSVGLRSQREVDSLGLVQQEYKALNLSKQIWTETPQPGSTDTHRAALALDVMLNRVAENAESLGLQDQEQIFSTFEPVKLPMDPLPFAGAVSQLIDGSECIDWVSEHEEPFHKDKQGSPEKRRNWAHQMFLTWFQ